MQYSNTVFTQTYNYPANNTNHPSQSLVFRKMLIQTMDNIVCDYKIPIHIQMINWVNSHLIFRHLL